MYTEVITERINAEDTLRRNEALLDATQRMARVGGWGYWPLSVTNCCGQAKRS